MTTKKIDGVKRALAHDLKTSISLLELAFEGVLKNTSEKDRYIEIFRIATNRCKKQLIEIFGEDPGQNSKLF